MDFISILSIFVLACFVGYYVVWSVTPALHTPLMSVTNAISSVIVVGALIAAAASSYDSPAKSFPQALPTKPCLTSTGQLPTYANDLPLDCIASSLPPTPAAEPPADRSHDFSHWLGLVAVALASVNIFGGFAVTARMLAMYKKKERKDA
jgi:NAD(P) transhydrogenase subunit alpha